MSRSYTTAELERVYRYIRHQPDICPFERVMAYYGGQIDPPDLRTMLDRLTSEGLLVASRRGWRASTQAGGAAQPRGLPGTTQEVPLAVDWEAVVVEWLRHCSATTRNSVSDHDRLALVQLLRNRAGA